MKQASGNAKKWLSYFLFLMTLLTGIGAATAGSLNEEFQNVFGAMTNYSGGGVVESGKRGSLVGPSVYLRVPKQKEKLISFQPPSLRAGCNGFDFFGGSLGFISHSEFQNLLRGIAANATGYAFQLAVNAACPSCGTLMDKLQAKIAALNEVANGDCKKMKEWFGEAGWDKKIEGFVSENAIERAVRSGSSQLTALNILPSSGSSTSKDSKTQQMVAAGEASKITGNVIFESMQDSAVDKLFLASGAPTGSEIIDLFETIQSFTGTVVLNLGTASDGSEPAVTPEIYRPTIDLAGLLDGGNFDILRCYGPSDSVTGKEKCINVGLVANQNVRGMKKLIVDAFMGVGGSSGIVDKVRDKNGLGGLTTQEKAIMASLSPATMGIIRNTMRDKAALRTVIITMSDTIAREFSYNYAMEMLASAYTAVLQHPKGTPDKAIALITERTKQIAEENKSLAIKEESTWSTILGQEVILRSMREASRQTYTGSPKG